jgi:hypothetical protein
MNQATAVSSTHNEMFHEPIWQKTQLGWSQSTPITLDTRGRVDAAVNTAANCMINLTSFGEKEEVVMIEVTQAVIPIPMAVTATMAYLRLSFGATDIERGAVEPYNAWYTEAIPLTPMGTNRVINLREVMQDARTLRYYNKAMGKLKSPVKLRLFTLDTAGQPVDIPYVADQLVANNYTVTVEVHTFKK